MTQIKFKGSPVHTYGELPTVGHHLPPFQLVAKDLSNVTLDSFKNKKKILSIVPSLDTGVCQIMTKKLNDFARQHPNVVVLTISADLPFAQSRFCQQEKLENVMVLSNMRSRDFALHYGLLITQGPLEGLMARALIVADEHNKILYSHLVPEITHEPDYEAAFSFFK